MSNIDIKIEEYKQMLADLEKQKKDEEEAYKNTIDWNMEQLDKYVDSTEIKVKKQTIDIIKGYCLEDKDKVNLDFYTSSISDIIRSNIYNSGIITIYNSTENLSLKRPLIKFGFMDYDIRHNRSHIFEFIYKILKHLFTSNKKISNYYDNVISRLDKLEEENKQLKTCQVNYYDIKERLNILEYYDIKNKLDIIEDRLDRIDIVGESILSKLSDYNEIREK
jgi:hypothetical protein